MQAVVFDLDQTIFDANRALREGVAELLEILNKLGLAIGAITNRDHRAIVQLDEAGVRHHFRYIICSDHMPVPKSPGAMERLLARLEVEPHQVVLVSNLYSDIVLGKKSGVAKTVGVSRGVEHSTVLRAAGADHIVEDIPAVLDVIQ
jgi:phosphoglycolate phosphatase-like HAD superfamily hydrolase